MIRLRDAATLAYTKLRVHKVRTSLMLGVTGILFGLIFAAIFVTQGIFTSIGNFSKEGLADRSIVAVEQWSNNYFDIYSYMDDPEFVAEVKKVHADIIAKKTAAAKKYGVQYDAATEDPSPTTVSSGKEVVSDNQLDAASVTQVVQQRQQNVEQPFDINAWASKYSSAKVLSNNYMLHQLVYMDDGIEQALLPESERSQSSNNTNGYYGSQEGVTVQVLNSVVTKPFVMQSNFDYSNDELPGVVSYSLAEKTLGLKALPKTATNDEKLARVDEVRHRISEVTSSFCYRNNASTALLEKALAQQKEIASNKNNTSYSMPSVVYNLPTDDSCGAVTVKADTRTEVEKQYDENYIAYQKEIGDYSGTPEQHKVVLRAVGLSGDASTQASAVGGAGEMVMSLMGSWLSYGDNWSIPADMLAQAPVAARPDAALKASDSNIATGTNFSMELDLVEFTDMKVARKAINENSDGSSGFAASSFGSSTLIIDDLKHWFGVAITWTLAGVGGVAFIILAGLIGRMVSEGRRESAVFRAIGARRSDIGLIYGAYTTFLAFRVMIFALVLGFILALVTDIIFSPDATTGARLAYAAGGTDKTFHFIGIFSWYIPLILAAILAVSLLASIIPIFLGARRSPINDMRNDA